MLRAIAVVRNPAVKEELVIDTMTLNADARTVHNDVAQGDQGLSFLVDLAKEVNLQHGDALKLEGGKLVRVISAEEPVLEVRAETQQRLLKAAWVLGGLHVPVAFFQDYLVIPESEELTETVRGLGCTTVPVKMPFNPERLHLGCGCGGHHHGHHHEHHEHHHGGCCSGHNHHEHPKGEENGHDKAHKHDM